MDHLEEVRKLTQKLEAQKAQYDETMRARNAAIVAARRERWRPVDLARASHLTYEQIRRILSERKA